MDNDETRKPDAKTRNVMTDDGDSAKQSYINVGNHGIMGETQRLLIHMN